MFDVINSSRFEIAIMLLILANMIVMTIQHYGQSETITETLDILFLLLIFTLISWSTNRVVYDSTFVLRVFDHTKATNQVTKLKKNSGFQVSGCAAF